MPKLKNRSKKKIIKKMNKIGHTIRFCTDNCPAKILERSEKIDEENQKIPFTIISKNNSGKRYDWWSGETYVEELDVNGANTERLRSFFKDHFLIVDNAIGRVEDIKIENDELVCTVAFGTDEDSTKIFRKYVEGLLTDVSIGYIIRDIVITEKKDEPTHILAIDYDILELSSVAVGFDKGAGVRTLKIKSPNKKKKKKKEKKSKKEDKRDIQILKNKLKLKGKKC